MVEEVKHEEKEKYPPVGELSEFARESGERMIRELMFEQVRKEHPLAYLQIVVPDKVEKLRKEFLSEAKLKEN